MICAQTIVHFRPKEAYDKYLKLLVGVMVLIQLFLPLGGYLLGAGGEDAARALEQFKREMEQAVREAEENAAAADALLEQMTLEEVRRCVEEQRGTNDAQPGEGPAGNGGEADHAREGGSADAGGEESETADVIRIEDIDPIRIGTDPALSMQRSDDMNSR